MKNRNSIFSMTRISTWKVDETIFKEQKLEETSTGKAPH